MGWPGSGSGLPAGVEEAPTAGAGTGRATGMMPAPRAAGKTERPTGIRTPAPGVPALTAHPPGARNRRKG
eukprot:1569377-Alexandrium_andersonii.AAC.1